MSHEYRVIADGHTHAGQPLAKGDVVTLRESVAALFPNVFQRLTAPARADKRASSRAETPETSGAAPETDH